MLTATQQHAVDKFAKSLTALGDDALIDTYHQAWEDHREASAEGSDNLSKAYERVLRPKRRCGIASLIIKAATSYGIREPVCPVPIVPIAHIAPLPGAGERASMLRHQSVHRERRALERMSGGSAGAIHWHQLIQRRARHQQGAQGPGTRSSTSVASAGSSDPKESSRRRAHALLGAAGDN